MSPRATQSSWCESRYSETRNYDCSIELLQAFTAMVNDILADEEAPGTKVLPVNSFHIRLM